LNIVEAEINLAAQTTILAVVLVSLAFRLKGNYKVHVATMGVAVALGLVITSVGTLNFSDSAYMATLTNPTVNFASFVSHAFFGIVSFISGLALLALLLMDKAIADRSNLVARITAVLWVVAYVVGVVFFVVLHVI
jgi:uncharacterized membrane protein YozB (DUF420 family)